MRHEGAKTGFISMCLNLRANTVTNDLNEFQSGKLPAALEDRYYKPRSSLEPFLVCLRCSFRASPVADAKQAVRLAGLVGGVSIVELVVRGPHAEIRIAGNQRNRRGAQRRQVVRRYDHGETKESACCQGEFQDSGLQIAWWWLRMPGTRIYSNLPKFILSAMSGRERRSTGVRFVIGCVAKLFLGCRHVRCIPR